VRSVVGGGAFNHLEVVAVHVDWVAARVTVVDYDLDDVVVVDDERICVLAVDDGVGSFFAGVQDGVQARDLLLHEGFAVHGEAKLGFQLVCEGSISRGGRGKESYRFWPKDTPDSTLITI